MIEELIGTLSYDISRVLTNRVGWRRPVLGCADIVVLVRERVEKEV